MMTRTLLLVALLLNADLAHAIVSMESLHTGAPPEGFSGTLEGSYKGSSGNSDKVDYGLGSRLQWHHATQTNFLLLSADYGEVAGVRNTRKGFSHLRHIRQFTPLLAGEAFLQAEYDDFARLEARRLAGGGARFTLYQREQGPTLLLGTGLFREYERIDPSYPDGGAELRSRANLYLVIKLPMGEAATLASNTYLQPALGDSRDYRLLEQATLQVKVTSRLALLLGVNHKHDSRPPLGLGSNDTSVTTSLVLSF